MAKIAARVKREIVKDQKTKLKAAEKSGDANAAAKAAEALEQLRRRPCARSREVFGVPPCTRTFAPELTVSGRTTQNYCGSECASLVLAEREGWRPQLVIDKMLGVVPAPVTEPSGDACDECGGTGDHPAVAGEKCPGCRGTGKVKRAPRPATPPAALPPRTKRERVPKDPASVAAHDASLTAKYGPTRAVKRVIKDRGKSKWCELDCGHEASVPAKSNSWRCGKCRTKTPKGA